MVRAGLSKHWACELANDFDLRKAHSYRANWGHKTLKVCDINHLKTSDLRPGVDMAWASFPCQDLSLAGGGAGLKGNRSGTFWPFINLMKSLCHTDSKPKIIAIENVLGTLTSNNGKDFASICEALENIGYRFGALIIDAARFVPQSRPRLFVIAIDKLIDTTNFERSRATHWTYSNRLQKAYECLPNRLKESWAFWDLLAPPERSLNLSDLVIWDRDVAPVDSQEKTIRLLNMMDEKNRQKVLDNSTLFGRAVGGLYKRTRFSQGTKVQRAEVRFDGLAGCLRTPAGGSSRQELLLIDRNHISSRLLTTREAARLMGLPESYMLPDNYNEAYHLCGDGVAVPVVSHLSTNFFEPLLKSALAFENKAA